MTKYDQAQKLRQKADDLETEFLTENGWRSSSHNPGSFVLWERDFADMDAERKAWDAEHPYGPGNPRVTIPYGVKQFDTSRALSITVNWILA